MIEITEDINAICADLLQRYKDEIDSTGHKASGGLENTASYRCFFSGKWFEVTFVLEDYWKYLENGTKPHFPPIDAIERWITVKRIVPRTNGNIVPTTHQLAYMIAHSISVKGTQPTKTLQHVIDGADDLINALCDALIKQIEETEINKDIEKVTNKYWNAARISIQNIWIHTSSVASNIVIVKCYYKSIV